MNLKAHPSLKGFLIALGAVALWQLLPWESAPQALAETNTALESNNYINEIADKAEIVHRLFAPIINFFAFHIGNFLGNDYIFAGAMGEMLKNIWVISRNLVNIFFVFALLWIALKAIFGNLVGEEVDIKKELLKIAVFLVAVNFSWLATKVVLDAANVVTNVVFSIPSGVSNSLSSPYEKCVVDTVKNTTEGMCVPTKIMSPADSGNAQLRYYEDGEECEVVKAAYKAVYSGENGSFNPDADDLAKERAEGVTSICWANLSLFDYNQNTSVVYLTYGMANIQNLVKTHNGDYGQLAVGTLFSVIIQVAYSLALLALFIAMIGRMAMLWLFVGFSPIMVAMIYLGGLDQGSGMKFSAKDFFRWSFAPAAVGVIFSVSFLMISAGQMSSKTLQQLNENTTFEGRVLDIGSIFSGMESIFDIVWLIMVLVILWVGVFAVINELPFVNTITNYIGDFGKTIGSSIAKTPFIAPIIPLSNAPGGYGSVRDLTRLVEARADWRTDSLSTNPRELIELEEKAKELSEDRNSRTRERIVREAGNGDATTLLSHFSKSADEFQQMNPNVREKLFSTSGFDESQRQTIIRAIETGRTNDTRVTRTQQEAAEAQRRAAEAQRVAAEEQARRQQAAQPQGQPAAPEEGE